MADQTLLSLLGNFVKEDTIKAIGNTAGTDVPQTKTALQNALPELIAGLSKNSKTKEGAESLMNALNDHNGSALNNLPRTIKSSDTQTDGAKILEHVFGGNQSAVVENVATKSGISTSSASGILQTIAPLFLETLGKTKDEQGLTSSNISDVLSGLLNNQSGGSFLLNLLDQDKDGDIKDDLFSMFINWIKSIFIKK